MDNHFAKRISDLQATIACQENDYDYVIDLDQVEEAVAILADYREALETIAYPANWLNQYPAGSESLEAYDLRMKSWMQAVAANALTNGGKKN